MSRTRRGAMRRVAGTTSHANAPCTTRARTRKAALTCRERVAHTPGPSRARATKGHHGRASRSRAGPGPRCAGAGHANAGGTEPPWPRAASAASSPGASCVHGPRRGSACTAEATPGPGLRGRARPRRGRVERRRRGRPGRDRRARAGPRAGRGRLRRAGRAGERWRAGQGSGDEQGRREERGRRFGEGRS
jgi:hypothetical protein